jgi:DNA gyrase subunit B
VVNALSESMDVRIWRGGREHLIRFAHGETVEPLTVVGPSDAASGTEVTFKPSDRTFTKTEYEFAVLERRLRELAFLNSGLAIALKDDRHVPAQEVFFQFRGGLTAFVEWLDQGKEPLFKPPIAVQAKEVDGIRVEIAMWWNNSPREMALCFTNNIPQRDGGTHQAGLRQALTRVVMKYAEDLAKKEKVELSGEDMREGLTCVLSVKVPDPKFSSQTKDKLVSSEVQPVVQARWPTPSRTGSRPTRRRRATSSTRWCSPPPRGRRRSWRGRRWGARTRSTSRPCPASSPTARRRTRASASCSSWRATAPAAPPSRAATACSRPSCRSRARS